MTRSMRQTKKRHQQEVSRRIRNNVSSLWPKLQPSWSRKGPEHLKKDSMHKDLLTPTNRTPKGTNHRSLRSTIEGREVPLNT